MKWRERPPKSALENANNEAIGEMVRRTHDQEQVSTETEENESGDSISRLRQMRFVPNDEIHLEQGPWRQCC